MLEQVLFRTSSMWELLQSFFEALAVLLPMEYFSLNWYVTLSSLVCDVVGLYFVEYSFLSTAFNEIRG